MYAKHVSDYLKKQNILVDEASYEFLDTTKSLKDNICLLGFGGSYAYGTNKEGSDVDIRGIATNSIDDLLSISDFEQVVNTDTDTTIYSVKKIFNLLTDCNPNTIEILGLDDYIYLNDIGKLILDNKRIFLSNDCIKSFTGYATAQMYRLQQKTLCALTPAQFKIHIAKVISNMKSHLIRCYGPVANYIDVYYNEETNELEIAIRKDVICAIDRLEDVLKEIHNVVSEYNKNSKRNKQALEHQKISKHSMHLLRLYMMCEDLLLKGEIITKRTEEHDLLMDIRNDKYLEAGVPNKEFFDIVHMYEDRLDKAKLHSVLPDKPDYGKIQQLFKQISKMVIERQL